MSNSRWLLMNYDGGITTTQFWILCSCFSLPGLFSPEDILHNQILMIPIKTTVTLGSEHVLAHTSRQACNPSCAIVANKCFTFNTYQTQHFTLMCCNGKIMRFGVVTVALLYVGTCFTVTLQMIFLKLHILLCLT